MTIKIFEVMQVRFENRAGVEVEKMLIAAMKLRQGLLIVARLIIPNKYHVFTILIVVSKAQR